MALKVAAPNYSEFRNPHFVDRLGRQYRIPLAATDPAGATVLVEELVDAAGATSIKLTPAQLEAAGTVLRYHDSVLWYRVPATRISAKKRERLSEAVVEAARNRIPHPRANETVEAVHLETGTRVWLNIDVVNLRRRGGGRGFHSTDWLVCRQFVWTSQKVSEMEPFIESLRRDDDDDDIQGGAQ